jgi:uncharacterized protein YjbI with pentapeptide repeats
MENTHLIGVDDHGLTYICTDLTELDDLFSNLRSAGLLIGVTFEESFTVNNDTNHVRFDFTSSQPEETVEVLLDAIDGEEDYSNNELSSADLKNANLSGANLSDANLDGAMVSAPWKIVDGKLVREQETANASVAAANTSPTVSADNPFVLYNQIRDLFNKIPSELRSGALESLRKELASS